MQGEVGDKGMRQKNKENEGGKQSFTPSRWAPDVEAENSLIESLSSPLGGK